MQEQNSQRWYKEPWPWILMSGPAAVIVAGVFTTWIAFASADGLVADDYYKQGLAINQEIKRERRAIDKGLTAQVEFSGGRLRVTLAGEEPEAIVAHLVHATRAGHDQRLRLLPTGGGTYEGKVSSLPAGRWQVAIEDPRREWRIVKEGL
jgi:uncharacterized protein